ncbi:MAG: esterase-like activity of phytase family protein, partial [Bacteroidota bacterium]
TRKDFEIDGVGYQQLDYDAFGGDFESILRDPNGDFWMCDEYRPAIYHFGFDGVLKERYVPAGTSMLGDVEQPAGFYGAETLPAVYSKRRANRGFEAMALDTDEGILYAFIQSPMYNPDNSTRNASDVIRILGVDPATGQPVSEYVYLLERNRDAGVGLSRVDKIGDAVYKGNGKFLVLERDSSDPDDGNTGKKYVFEIDINGATNLLGTALSEKSESTGADDKTLEMMTADDLAEAGIIAVHKTKVLNLPSIGYLPSDKPEGLALLPNNEIAVMNDNDFGLAGAGVSDAISLGIIGFQFNYGFDASDRSESIDIRQRPTRGMYQPDAITTYELNGQTYLFTANEGDARDYDGFSEEERVDDLDLDPGVYPAENFFQEDSNLGRLKTTSVDGDTDGDGDVDQIHSYGARSFSIWDANGNQVFDSGDMFERVTAQIIPEFFNSQGDDRLKNRSDDKGPEPEAIAVGEVDGRAYAFIALERVGGVFIYDVTDPFNAYYVDYVFNRNFELEPEDDPTADIAPEDVKFVPASDNALGQPLLIVASEVSGTISAYTIGVATQARSAATDESLTSLSSLEWHAYPNPVQQQLNVSYHLEETAEVELSLFDMMGRELKTFVKSQQDRGFYTYESDLTDLPKGVYTLSLRTGGKIFSKLVMKN